jgi:hypothetical protein
MLHNRSLQQAGAAILVSESNLSLSSAAAVDYFSFARARAHKRSTEMAAAF